MCRGTGKRWTILGGLLAATSAGCVSLDQHRQLQMSQMKLEAEKAQVQVDLDDARSVADSLRTKLTALEGELRSKNDLVANLQGENDRLDESFRTCSTTLEKLADKAIPDNVVMVENKLPPQLDAALKQFAAQYPSSVSYDERSGTVKWKSDLLFALGSDVVKESAMESLRGFAEVIGSDAAAQFEIIVVGHTDDRPITRAQTRAAHPSNWHLSAHRAIAVSNALQNDQYDPARIGVMGFGEHRPVLANDSEENRARNRRVEVYIVPRGTLAPAASGSDRAERQEPPDTTK